MFYVFSLSKGQQFVKFVKTHAHKNTIEKKFDPRIVVLQHEPGQTGSSESPSQELVLLIEREYFKHPRFAACFVLIKWEN